MFEFVKACIPGDDRMLVSEFDMEDVRIYLKEGGYEVPSLSQIIAPKVTNTGYFPLVINGVNCILQIMREIGGKELEEKEKKLSKKKARLLAKEEEAKLNKK